jgi:hypothetical protein
MMPCEVVNQILLEAEYAVQTVFFSLEVHRGPSPGAPKAWPWPSIQRYCSSGSLMDSRLPHVHDNASPIAFREVLLFDESSN